MGSKNDRRTLVMEKQEINEILLLRGLRLARNAGVMQLTPFLWLVDTVPKFRDAPPQVRYVRKTPTGFKVSAEYPLTPKGVSV